MLLRNHIVPERELDDVTEGASPCALKLELPLLLKQFRPDDLDLDQLALAIERLLESRDSDLLSGQNRATHVVGGTKA
jgi:hypothetical protein